ncbi:MAG TPA: hypothetical protein VKS78_13665 [Roseiarcus sp.]|nr:hypothetical protein [Roseiarcus sp.]
MIRIALLAVVFCLAFPGPAGAQSDRVKAACRSDAMKLCWSVIRDVNERRACMKAHAAELSKPCTTRFTPTAAPSACGRL